MFNTLKRSAAALAIASLISAPAFAADLVINFDDPNPAPKEAVSQVRALGGKNSHISTSDRPPFQR